MTDHRQALLTQLQEKFADALLSAEIVHREITIETVAEHLSPLCQTLRDEFGFEQLMDLCGIDYSTYGQADWDTQQATRSGFSRGVSPAIHQEKPKQYSRFAVVYHLLSIQHNQRLRVRAFIEHEPLRIDSVIPIWNVANWFEREAFDLYGILFEGHPDSPITALLDIHSAKTFLSAVMLKCVMIRRKNEWCMNRSASNRESWYLASSVMTIVMQKISSLLMIMS